MSYLDGLEYDFVLGDLSVVHEFDMSNFIMNAKTSLQNTNVKFDARLKFDYYASILEKAIQSLYVIKLDKASIRAFLSKFQTLDKVDRASTALMTRDLNYKDEIIEFRPQFLTQYCNMVQTVINKVLNGESSVNDVGQFLSEELPLKVKKQVVKTTLPYEVKPKDLIQDHSVPMVEVNTTFVKEKLIPFVLRYDEIKEEVIAEANSVLSTIKDTETTIKAMYMTVNSLKEKNLDSVKNADLNMVTYNAVRGILSVISFITYMMIRKINTVSDTIMACNRTYIDILNVYAVEQALNPIGGNSIAVPVNGELPSDYIVPTDTFSVADDFLKGDSDAFTLKAERIYNFHAALPNAKDIEHPDTGMDKVVADINANNAMYDAINSMFAEISRGLDTLGLEANGMLLIYDDMIKKSGFGIVLRERFQNTLNDILDVSTYGGNLNDLDSGLVNWMTYKACLDEVKLFGDRVKVSAKLCHEAFDKLMMLKNRFDRNINGEFADVEGINQLKVFLKTLYEQYVELTNITTENLMKRLNMLGEELSKMDTNLMNPEDNIAPDVIPEVHANLDLAESSVIDDTINLYHNEMIALKDQYVREMQSLITGKNVVTEAPVPGASPVTQKSPVVGNGNNNQQQNKPGQPNAQNDKSKVTVQDNNPEANAKGGAGSLPKKIGERFTARLEKFRLTADRQSKKNDPWLKANEEGLTSRSYTNVTINIPPYDNVPVQNIVENCNKVASNIKTLNPMSVQAIQTKLDMYRKIFPFVSGITDTAPLQSQFTKELSGTDENLSTIAISNGVLEQKIRGEYIPYCKQYYSNTVPNTVRNITSIAQAFDALLDEFQKDNANVPMMNVSAPSAQGTPAPSQNTAQESVSLLYEADQNQNGTKDASVGQKLNWIKDAIEQFANQVIFVLQNRTNAYFKVLSSLAPAPAVKPVKAETQKVPQNNAENNFAENPAETQQAEQQA